MATTAVTIVEIDAALTRWRESLQTASDNLMAVRGLDAYKRLRGEGGRARVEPIGITRDRVTIAGAALTRLWDLHSHCSATIEKATSQRATLSRFLTNKKTIASIEYLRTGPVILQPTAPNRPIQERSLLTRPTDEQPLTLEQAMEEMRIQFRTARDAFTELEGCWTKLPERLNSVGVAIEELARLGVELGENAPPELQQVGATLGELRHRSAVDPLGVEREIEDLLGRLRETKTAFLNRRKDRAALGNDLTTARDLCRSVEAAHEEAVRARDERAAAVRTDYPPGVLDPADEAKIAVLTPALDRLASELTNDWQQAKPALEKWIANTRKLLTAERSARDTNLGLLRFLRDAVDRLASFRERAKTSGVESDSELVRLSNEADGLLGSPPVPLARMQQIVREYEARLLRAAAKR